MWFCWLSPKSFILPLCLYLLPVELSTLFPDKLMLGLEIRVKVSDYVRDRIQSLRASESEKYQNIACIRSNAMKYLPNFFCKGQVHFHESSFTLFSSLPSYLAVQFSCWMFFLPYIYVSAVWLLSLSLFIRFHGGLCSPGHRSIAKIYSCDDCFSMRQWEL